MRKYVCSICGYVYDEDAGLSEKDIPPKTIWEDVPITFTCPICAVPKKLFTLDEETQSTPILTPDEIQRSINKEAASIGDIQKLSNDEISVICSNLAKGCEKQRLIVEKDAFNKLADYFKSKPESKTDKTLIDVIEMLDNDLKEFSTANNVAKANADRGALRSLVWSEKVSMMMKSLLERFAKEGENMLKNTKVYVCDICGFIYLGDALPEICPVCKVPNYKIIQIER